MPRSTLSILTLLLVFHAAHSIESDGAISQPTSESSNAAVPISPTPIVKSETPDPVEEAETPQDKSQEEIHKTDSLLIQVQLVLLVLTLVSGYALRKKRVFWVHETGLALIYGLVAGLIILGITNFETNAIKEINNDNSSKGETKPHNNPTALQCSTKHLINGSTITKPLSSPNYTVAIEIELNETSKIYSYKLLGEVDEPEAARFDDELKKITFDAEIFFQLLLPPIIFYAAYSMRKRHFFRNIGAILTYSFIGTIIATCVTAGIVYLFVIIAQGISSTSVLHGFQFYDCLYFGAIISATDPVTVLAVFKEKRVDVDLDALLFGESILNDAVAIVLASAINKAKESATFSSIKVIGNFFGVFFGSFAIGASIGIVNAIAFKFIPLTSEPAVETSLFVLISWSAFMTAESLDCSGIVSVLFAGILQAQYTYRNMSPQSQNTTKEFFHLLSFIAENFVFCYMGLTMATSSHHSWSLWFILGSFIGIIVGRACNIYPLSWILNLGRGKKISKEFQHMMMWSGLRGAMAFALAVRETLSSTQQTIFTTTLLICYLTVLVLGGGTNYVLQALHIPINVDPDADLKGSGAEPTWVFKQWHKLDRKFLRKCLVRKDAAYANDRSDESPVISGSQGFQANSFDTPHGAVRLEEEYDDDAEIAI